MAEKSDAMVIREYFGLLPGCTLKDFLGEYKALTAEDKIELAEGIRNETFTY